jgi:carboxypeptidase family protein
LEFVLPQSVRVTLKWPLPESIDLSTVLLRLQSEAEIFVGEERNGSSQGHRFRRALGARLWGAAFGRNGGYVNFRLEPDQTEFFLWGMNPGVAMEVSLVGPSMATLSSSGPLKFSAGEDRVVELLMPVAPTDFLGKVMDPNGLPLSGVTLEVHLQRYSYEGKTAENGSFSFVGLGASTLEITLNKPGFATRMIEAYATPPDGKGVEIVMEPARAMTIFLRDENGKNHRGGLVKTKTSWSERQLEFDGYLLENIPQSSFELTWLLGGATGKVIIPAEVTEYVIPVPAMATALVHISRMQAINRGSLVIQFFPWDDQAAEPTPAYSASAALAVDEKDLALEIPSLQPGKYRVILATWRVANGSWGYQPLDEIGPIVFTAGNTFELSMGY